MSGTAWDPWLAKTYTRRCVCGLEFKASTIRSAAGKLHAHTLRTGHGGVKKRHKWNPSLDGPEPAPGAVAERMCTCGHTRDMHPLAGRCSSCIYAWEKHPEQECVICPCPSYTSAPL